MDAHNLDRAAEFCKLVDVADLLAYLKLPADVTPDEARSKLKARRKYMQGMQGNPKYKREAIYLIKHFSALDTVLSDPPTYLADAMKRAESVHLPILEMTVKGVLAAGGLTQSQEEYLRRNATELGVTDETFEELMDRLCGEQNIVRPSKRAAQRGMGGAPTVILDNLPPAPTGDFYRFLGVAPAASESEVRAAYERKRAEVDAMAPGAEAEEARVRLSLVWSVLSDREARSQYNISSTRTGPPARNRERAPSPTAAQPAAAAASDGGRAARLEVESSPQILLRVGSSSVQHGFSVRNAGEQPMRGEVQTTAAWLTASPRTLDPNQREQTITLTVSPELLPDGEPIGRARILTEGAGEATIEVKVQRGGFPIVWIAAGAAALFMMAAVLTAILLFALSASPSSLIVRVDPTSEQVALDGQILGSGPLVTSTDPPPGPATLTVTHAGFEPWSREIVVEDVSGQIVDVVLEPSDPLAFVPGDEHRRGSIPGEVAQRTVDTHKEALDRCLRVGLEPGQAADGVLRLHVGTDGDVSGFEIEGSATGDKASRACLERIGTTMTFAPLSDGDYATVRYTYKVVGQASP